MKTRRIERRIGLARAVLAFERVWPSLWPATGILGAFLAAALLNLFSLVPWSVHALILSASITAAGLLLYLNLRDVRRPRWEEGARRIERDSDLRHRPISEADDALAAGSGDTLAEDLWRAHLRLRLEGVSRLRLRPPASGLAARDRYAVRYAILLLLIAGVGVAGRGSLERLLASVTSAGQAGSATIDAWIVPPAYTGEAPIYLGRTSSEPSAVPTGSVLNLRVHGASHLPGLSVGGHSESFSGGNGEYAGTIAISSDEDIRVRASGRTLGDWSFRALPDNPPSIAFAAAPSKTEHDALKLSYAARDDYGVVRVRAIIRPHGRTGSPLILELPLATESARNIRDTVYRDLTEHPYAGLDVDIALEASDAIGQTALTPAHTFRLPARVFTNPLARALVELRQQVAGDPAGRGRVLKTIDALTISPERFYDGQPNVYTGLRAAYWALRTARHEDEFSHVEALLWQIALSLERGGLSVAAEELRRLQQMITEALAQGAPQEVIDALMERYQQALQRYMQELAQNAPSDSEPVPPGSKVLSEKDLNDLMKLIEQLAQSGDRESAAKMMAVLEELIENLHMTKSAGQDGQPGGSGAQSPADKALSDTIQGLGELMGKQRGLLDRNFRQQQGQGDKNGTAGMAQEQGQLRSQLDKLLGSLKGQKRAIPKDLGDAGQTMGEAQQQLGANDLGSAGETQKEALDSLRKGAGELARQLMRGSGSQAGNEGQQDPLGRQQGSNGSDFGAGVRLPSTSDLQRARSILEELRKRAAERGRPKQELDYIDRLLKQF